MIRHLYRDLDGSLLDVSAYVRRLEWQSVEKAEEGSVGSWQVIVDDLDGELDFHGHRQWFIEETTSEATDDLVFGGFVADQTITAWPGMPLGRVWEITLTDANTFWQRTIMRGTDCNRPEETDVARMAWLLSTAEAAMINDIASYVQVAGGVAMDAHDYRGEYLGQIVSDCAMQSGRNWFLFFQKQGDGTRDMIAWYARDTVTAYQSPLYITNDLADLELDGLDDGSTVIYPMAADTKLHRDPSRVYCGCYMAYEEGATYRHLTSTHDAFGHRDISATQPTVKTKAKAQARADRMLADLDEQDIRITTSVILPAAKVTQLKAGMRTEIRGTHWPEDWSDWHYVRVLQAAPEPISVGREYRVGLELGLNTGATSPGPPSEYTGTVFAGLQRSDNNNSTGTGNGMLQWDGAYPPGLQFAGWYTAATTGPIALNEGAQPFHAITVSSDMVVRIHCVAQFSQVYFPAKTIDLHVTVNGGVVGSDSILAGPGFFGGTLEVDLHDYPLVAGDVIAATGTDPEHWGNSGINTTFLKVGRGTTVDISTGNPVFTGP